MIFFTIINFFSFLKLFVEMLKMWIFIELEALTNWNEAFKMRVSFKMRGCRDDWVFPLLVPLF